jgi:hypothetical protein
MAIPARRPGSTGDKSFAGKMQWVPPFSVASLIESDRLGRIDK